MHIISKVLNFWLWIMFSDFKTQFWLPKLNLVYMEEIKSLTVLEFLIFNICTNSVMLLLCFNQSSVTSFIKFRYSQSLATNSVEYLIFFKGWKKFIKVLSRPKNTCFYLKPSLDWFDLPHSKLKSGLLCGWCVTSNLLLIW